MSLKCDVKALVVLFFLEACICFSYGRSLIFVGRNDWENYLNCQIVAKYEQFQKLGKGCQMTQVCWKKTMELVKVVIAASVLNKSNFEKISESSFWFT